MNIKTRFAPIFLGSLFALAVLSGAVHAQTGYGTSSIQMSPSGGVVTQGHPMSFNYTVNLASGGTWGTNLQVSNQAQLSAAGITVALTAASGDPPFSGRATITTSGSTTPGPYNVTLVATGDDPSSPATFALNIISAQSSSSAQSTSTIGQ